MTSLSSLQSRKDEKKEGQVCLNASPTQLEDVYGGGAGCFRRLRIHAGAWASTHWAETPRSRTCLNNSFHEHENMFFQKARKRMLLPSVPHIAERCLISLKINQVGEECRGEEHKEVRRD